VVDVVDMVVVPVPVRAAALVTEPCVRTILTGLTLSLDGPGTRLCQLGVEGHVGRAAAAGLGDTTTATAAAMSVLTTAPRVNWKRRLRERCALDPRISFTGIS
jgi:hypothetical protein